MHRSARVAIVLGTWLVAAPAVRAHDLARSESVFEQRGTTLAATVTVDALEFPDVDTDRNSRISYDELDRAIAAIFGRLKEHLRLQAHVPPARITLDRHELIEDEHVLRLQLTYVYAEPVREITVTSTLDELGRPDHQHLVTVLVEGERAQAVLDRANRSATLATVATRVTAARLLAAVGALLLVGGLVWLRVRGRGRVTSR